jgi:hypothetical protein
VGTWGTGPFDNDAAGDLLEELAECGPDERAALLRQLFAAVLRDPDAPSYEVAFPAGYVDGLTGDEVVAAATLVALALPGGERILELPAERAFPGGGIADLLADASVSGSARALAPMAAEALRTVTDPARPWSRARIDGGDRELAMGSVAQTLRVLDAAAP